MNNQNTAKFWTKFSRYLLIGFSALTLLAASQQMVLGGNFQRGPQNVAAQDGNFEYVGSEPLEPGVGDDGNFEYVGSEPLEPAPVSQQPAPAPQPPAPTPSCPDDHQYCDTNVNKLIHKHGGYWNGSQCVYAFDVVGVCNQPAPAPQPPAPQPAPQPVVTTTQLPACPKPGQSGTQQICGGQWAYDTCTITERFSDGTPAKYKCSYSQNSNCVGTYSCPAPAPVVTTQACQIKTTKTEQTCIGAQLCTFNFQQQSDCSVVKKGPFNCFESTQCRAVVQPPVVVAPIVPVAQGAGPVNVTNNNNNTNNNSNTNNNTISVNASAPREVVREVRTVTAAAPTVVYQQPEVAGVQVKELPKTGLPAAAWAALAFIPAGFRMRRFRKVQGELADSPVYIWEKRQYNSNYEQI